MGKQRLTGVGHAEKNGQRTLSVFPVRVLSCSLCPPHRYLLQTLYLLQTQTVALRFLSRDSVTGPNGSQPSTESQAVKSRESAAILWACASITHQQQTWFFRPRDLPLPVWLVT